jgi:hypothetical protein
MDKTKEIKVLFSDNGHGAANAAGFGWRNGG